MELNFKLSVKTPLMRVASLGDVCLLSFSFIFIFAAYMVVQNLASSVFPGSIGFITLGVLYMVFGCVNIGVSSTIVCRLGLRVSLVVASLGYTLFILANYVGLGMNQPLMILIPAAIIIGLCAGVLWTAQGTYVSMCASVSGRYGFYSGVFFACFNINQIAGNLSAAFLLGPESNPANLFLILSGVEIIGTLCMLPLAKEPQRPSQTRRTTMEILQFLVSDKRIRLLCGLYIFTGACNTFVWGTLPLLVLRDFSLKLYLMLVFGCADVIASFSLGRISDRIGFGPTLVFGLLLQLTAMIIVNVVSVMDEIVPLMVIAVLLGIVDACLNTQLSSLIPKLFSSSELEQAFASTKFFQSLSTGILFFVSSKFVNETNMGKIPRVDLWLIVIIPLMAWSFVSLWLLRRNKTGAIVENEESPQVMNMVTVMQPDAMKTNDILLPLPQTSHELVE